MSRSRQLSFALVAICLLLPSVALAQNWVSLVTDGAGRTHYWRGAPRGAEQPAWVRVDHRVELSSPLVAGGVSYLSMQYRLEIDCASNRYHEIGLTGFTGPGLSGTRVDAPARTEWHTVEPQGVMSVLAPAACWRPLMTGSDGYLVKVLAPYAVGGNSHRFISTLSDIAPFENNGSTLRSAIMEYEIDCANYAFSNTTVTFFDGAGATGRNWTVTMNSAWGPTSAGSVNYAIAQAACS